MTPTVQKWGLALFFLLGTTILLKAYDTMVPYGVRYVRTPSIPEGLYGSKRYDGTALVRGETACFRPAPTGWVAERGYIHPNATLCKYVLGVPGDEIRPQGERLSICQAGRCTDAGKVMPTDRQGRPSMSAFPAPVVIPEGQYYLGSTHHERSFDSRYLGLVDARSITARAWPLWTR